MFKHSHAHRATPVTPQHSVSARSRAIRATKCGKGSSPYPRLPARPHASVRAAAHKCVNAKPVAASLAPHPSSAHDSAVTVVSSRRHYCPLSPGRRRLLSRKPPAPQHPAPPCRQPSLFCMPRTAGRRDRSRSGPSSAQPTNKTGACDPDGSALPRVHSLRPCHLSVRCRCRRCASSPPCAQSRPPGWPPRGVPRSSDGRRRGARCACTRGGRGR